MSIESKFDGNTVTTVLTDGSFSFEMKLTEKSTRNLNLVLQHGWMDAIKKCAADICNNCMFDRECEKCPLYDVYIKASQMQCKIAAEMEKNRKDKEETK